MNFRIEKPNVRIDRNVSFWSRAEMASKTNLTTMSEWPRLCCENNKRKFCYSQEADCPMGFVWPG